MGAHRRGEGEGEGEVGQGGGLGEGAARGAPWGAWGEGKAWARLARDVRCLKLLCVRKEAGTREEGEEKKRKEKKEKIWKIF
jgi:hypothetical protein